MKKFTLMIVMLCFAVINNFAQSSKIGFDIDYSQFSFDADSNLVEFYYSFDNSTMMKVKEDSTLYVDGLLTISVEDTVNHKFIINKQWQFKDDFNTTQPELKSMVGVLAFVIPKGVYNCKFTGSNFYDTSHAVVYKEILNVNPFIS